LPRQIIEAHIAAGRGDGFSLSSGYRHARNLPHVNSGRSPASDSVADDMLSRQRTDEHQGQNEDSL
jgi:hypothetical protein